jgi:hypothetical protein
MQQGWKRVLVLPDPGKAGIKGGLKILEACQAEGLNAKMVYPIPAKQADDYTEEELDEVLKKSSAMGINDRLRLSVDILEQVED